MNILKFWGVVLAFSISVWGCSNEDSLKTLGETPTEEPFVQEGGDGDGEETTAGEEEGEGEETEEATAVEEGEGEEEAAAGEGEETTAAEEEGAEDGEDEISHLPWWDSNYEMETTCLRACVVDAHGNPPTDTYFEAVGVDYNGNSIAVAGADGCACLPVRIDSQVRVQALRADAVAQSDIISTGSTPLACGSTDCSALPEPLVLTPPPFQAVLTGDMGGFNSILTGPCPYGECPGVFARPAEDGSLAFLVDKYSRGSLFEPPFASFVDYASYTSTLFLENPTPDDAPQTASISACNEGTYRYSVCSWGDAAHGETADVLLLLPDGSQLNVSAASLSSSNWLRWVVGELHCPSDDCQECIWVPINTFSPNMSDSDDPLDTCGRV